MTKHIQILSRHWGIPAAELEAVLSQPAVAREAALEALIKKYGKGMDATMVSLGLSDKPDLWAYMRGFASQLTMDQTTVGIDMDVAIAELEPLIDFSIGNLYTDSEMEHRVSEYMASGDTGELSKPKQSEFGFSLEVLAMANLEIWFGKDSEELGNRLRAFRRQKAIDAGGLAAGGGFPANPSDVQIRQRIKEWWAGRYDPGTGSIDQTAREDMVREFMDGYVGFILDEKGILPGSSWRAVMEPILKNKGLNPPPRGFDLLKLASVQELK